MLWIATTTTVQTQSYYPELDSEQQYGKWVIELVAQYHELDADELLRPAWCESRFRPSARGDNKRSHGLYQLNDLDTGLIWHFYNLGYTDAYNPWQAADYYARVKKGEFAPWSNNAPSLHPYGYILVSRWSCK